MDLLKETDALNLIQKCNYGLDCMAPRASLCYYQSKFGLGWIYHGKI